MVTKIPLVNYSGTIKEIAPSDTIAASYVGLGSVTNDAQTKAAIVPNTTPAAGNILVGNVGGTAYASVAMSGGATISPTGAVTVTGIPIGGNTGSLLFKLSGGLYDTAWSSNVYLDDTNARIGFGVSAPAYSIDILNTSTRAINAFTSLAAGTSGGAGMVFGTTSTLNASDYRVGYLYGSGYMGATLKSPAGLIFYTAEDWSGGTSCGSYVSVRTTLNGASATSEALRIGNNANIWVQGAYVDQSSGSSAPASGATINVADNCGYYLLRHLSTIATLTVNFPVNPTDGQRFTLAAWSIVTALTLASGGTIRGTLTTILANGFATWSWRASSTTWTRIG